MNITAENIKMKIGDNEILKGVSIDSKNREFVGIIGPNGSGKSTLLKSIYRILKPNDGCIKLDDMDISKMSIKESAKKMAVVSQHNYYNFDFTVKEVVSMGRSPHKKNLERDNIEDFKIVKESLQKVGMSEFSNRSFSTLSGGEQQRVSIARAIAKKPKILLCDEPTGALDYQTGKQVLKILQEMSRDYGATVIIVTHNTALAPLANRVIHMHDARVKSIVLNETPQAIEELEY